jgi:hypothetical protein
MTAYRDSAELEQRLTTDWVTCVAINYYRLPLRRGFISDGEKNQFEKLFQYADADFVTLAIQPGRMMYEHMTLFFRESADQETYYQAGERHCRSPLSC